MTASSRDRLAAGARRELEEDILPFWRPHGRGRAPGGFIARMSNDLRLDEDARRASS